MKRFILIIAFVQLLTFPVAAQASPLTGLTEVNRYKFTVLGYVKIFSASLHMPEDALNAYAFPFGSEMALKFVYHQNIKKEELIKRGNAALSKQFDPLVMQKHKASLAAINSAYTNVSKGNSYILRFTPSMGLSLFLNEVPVLTINDDAFASFYLSIWLGESTPNQIIRNSLIPTFQ